MIVSQLSGRLVAGRAGLVLACALTVAGCLPGRSTAERVIERFVTAVQDEDLDTLYCLLAGASSAAEVEPENRRRSFDEWARSRYEEYLAGRDRGVVDFGESGLTLVKSFALGRGTFYRIASTHYRGGGELDVRTEVRFGYGQANYGTFSPGTTFYLAGDPPGRIVSVRVPYESREITREVLETITLDWKLVNVDATEDCPAGWVVASVRPAAGSQTTSRITWPF